MDNRRKEKEKTIYLINMNTNHIHLLLVWQIHDNLNSEDRLSVSCFHLFFCRTVSEWQALLFQLNCTWNSKVVLLEQSWSGLEMTSRGRAGPLCGTQTAQLMVSHAPWAACSLPSVPCSCFGKFFHFLGSHRS